MTEDRITKSVRRVELFTAAAIEGLCRGMARELMSPTENADRKQKLVAHVATEIAIQAEDQIGLWEEEDLPHGQ